MPVKKHPVVARKKTSRIKTRKTTNLPRKSSIDRATPKLKSSMPGVTAGQISPISALVNELAKLRATVETKLTPLPSDALIDEVDAIRRVLSDIMENRSTVYLQKLAAIRQCIPAQSGDILDRIDDLMKDMGAITFATERLEHFDPIIHTVGREVQHSQFPDGVIIETLHPGCRTAHGQVLTKAIVAINRRT